MEAMRERWTDDRMDDLVNHVDRGFTQVDAHFAQIDARFAQVDERFAQVHADQLDLRKELHAGQIGLRKELGEKSSRQELAELRAEMSQRFDRLQNMLLTGFLTLIVTMIATQIT